MKVLIVDDSSTILKIVKNTLLNEGIDEIYEALDGKQAYDTFLLHSPDIVFTDWNMPVMNGLELIKKIRGDGNKTPIIMVTTEGRKEEVLTALRSGANDYIVKPFTPKVIKDKINKFRDVHGEKI